MGDKNGITNLLNHLFTISYSINFFPASEINHCRTVARSYLIDQGKNLSMVLLFQRAM